MGGIHGLHKTLFGQPAIETLQVVQQVKPMQIMSHYRWNHLASNKILGLYTVVL